MKSRELTLKETLNGIVATNLLRMFKLQQARTVYMVNSELGAEQLVGFDIVKALIDKLEITVANNLAAAGGGGNTMLYLDIDLAVFQPFDADGVLLHLERNASRLAAMLKRFHSEIRYTGIIITVGTPPYRSELFDLNPARIMLALSEGLNNHLPHQCTEMVGHYVAANEAQRIPTNFIPLHTFAFSFDLQTPAKPNQPTSLPSWNQLISDEPLDLLLAAQIAANAEPEVVELVAADALENPPEPEPVAPTELEQQAVDVIEAIAPLQEVMDEVLIGSALLNAGGVLRAADSLISYVIFPANINGKLQRIGFCQNGVFVTHDGDGEYASSISVMLGNQLAIDLVTESEVAFLPDELDFLQGRLDRNALMDFYLTAIQAIGSDTEVINKYLGGVEQLREHLEKFFEVLPSKLN